MSTQKLVGQFIRDDNPKQKRHAKKSISPYGANISGFNMYKYNGFVFTKKGAL